MRLGSLPAGSPLWSAPTCGGGTAAGATNSPPAQPALLLKPDRRGTPATGAASNGSPEMPAPSSQPQISLSCHGPATVPGGQTIHSAPLRQPAAARAEVLPQRNDTVPQPPPRSGRQEGGAPPLDVEARLAAASAALWEGARRVTQLAHERQELMERCARAESSAMAARDACARLLEAASGSPALDSVDPELIRALKAHSAELHELHVAPPRTQGRPDRMATPASSARQDGPASGASRRELIERGRFCFEEYLYLRASCSSSTSKSSVLPLRKIGFDGEK